MHFFTLILSLHGLVSPHDEIKVENHSPRTRAGRHGNIRKHAAEKQQSTRNTPSVGKITTSQELLGDARTGNSKYGPHRNDYSSYGLVFDWSVCRETCALSTLLMNFRFQSFPAVQRSKVKGSSGTGAQSGPRFFGAVLFLLGRCAG